MTSSIVLTSKSLAFIKEKCSVDSDWTALIWCPVLVDHYSTVIIGNLSVQVGGAPGVGAGYGHSEVLGGALLAILSAHL